MSIFENNYNPNLSEDNEISTILKLNSDSLTNSCMRKYASHKMLSYTVSFKYVGNQLVVYGKTDQLDLNIKDCLSNFGIPIKKMKIHYLNSTRVKSQILILTVNNCEFECLPNCDPVDLSDFLIEYVIYYYRSKQKNK
jgi:hypothetical protein